MQDEQLAASAEPIARRMSVDRWERLEKKPPAVLVVDDCIEVCRALARDLRALGRPVHVSQTHEHAVTILSHADLNIDAAVVDLLLEREDGLELLDLIAKQRPRVRRVLISGRVEYRLLEQLRLMGTAHAVLSKPWDRNALATALDL